MRKLLTGRIANCPDCGETFDVRQPGATFTVMVRAGSPMGLRIDEDVRKLFMDRRRGWIRLDLDGVEHVTPLAEDWPQSSRRGRAYVQSDEIEAWLHRRGLVEWRDGNPPEVEVVYLGSDLFRLVPPASQ